MGFYLYYNALDSQVTGYFGYCYYIIHPMDEYLLMEFYLLKLLEAFIKDAH